jgi:hypothetical protein
VEFLKSHFKPLSATIKVIKKEFFGFFFHFNYHHNVHSDEGSTVEGGNHSGASNNLSNESLEMPPLPTMDSGDGDHF